MYISQHIDSKVDRILYVDPDVVCINSFQNDYSNIFEQMDQKFTIGVYTASTEDHNKLMFKELNIKRKVFQCRSDVYKFKNGERIKLPTH